jgi:hypothetical protein
LALFLVRLLDSDLAMAADAGDIVSMTVHEALSEKSS